MSNPVFEKLTKSWKRIGQFRAQETAIETLSAFIRDSEHEMISTATALQAHIDLLHDEQVRNRLPVDRFDVLNHAIDRLIKDTGILATVAAEAELPVTRKRWSLKKLIQDVVEETSAALSISKVSLNFDVPENATVVGNDGLLKMMIKELVLVVLPTCHEMDTLNITGRSLHKRISLSFEIGSALNNREFLSWQLGSLRLIPTNGEGIMLSAVDAMAKLNNGYLSVRGSTDNRKGYRLTFSGQ